MDDGKLIPAHFKNLRASALNDSSIEIMGCRSVPREEFESISPALVTCESILEFTYPGVDHFPRYRLFPPQGKVKYFQPAGTTPHLYILPLVRVVLPDPRINISFVEGEKKCACLTQHAQLAVGLGGVWSWVVKDSSDLLPEFNEIALVDRSVLIVFDSDCWIKPEIQRALYAFGKALEGRGARVEALVIPPAADGSRQGADDFIATNGVDQFKELKRIKLRHDALNQFKPWWESWVKGKAHESKELAKVSAMLQPVEPWLEPVNGLELANEIRSTFKRFVVTVQPEALVVEALWVLLAHTLDAFGISPILAFWSPVHECGKSVNQSIVGKLTPKPLEGSSMTEAVVFRVVEKFSPTILIDEVADQLKTRPELMSLLRASHMRSKAFVYRTVGDSHEVAAFSTWSAKSLAVTTTNIEAALASRCLIVKMQRKTKRERTEKFSSNKEYPELDDLRRKCVRWAQDNISAVREAVPTNYPDLENRSSDNFEPLLKIAHVIGGDWPRLIADAAIKLLGGDNPIEQSSSLELLKDIKLIFETVPEASDGRKIASADLVSRLVAKEDRPWSDYRNNKPITQNQLGRLLKDFFIHSRKIWVGDKSLQGYVDRQFNDAFERYIEPDQPHTESQLEGWKTARENDELGGKTQLEGDGNLPVDENGSSTCKTKEPSSLPVVNSEIAACLDRFSSVEVVDPEFYVSPGGNPSLHCAGNLNLRTGAVSCALSKDIVQTPYKTTADSVVIGYSGSSDLTAFLQSGYDLPSNYLDLAVITKLENNRPRLRKTPSLIEALDLYGIHHDITLKEKKKEQRRYAKPMLTDDDRRAMIEYCPNDCRYTAELFSKLAPCINFNNVLRFGEWIKECSRISYRGVPVDRELFQKICRNREQIRMEFIDASPVGRKLYTYSGTQSKKKIAAWIDECGFVGWQQTPKSGEPCLQTDYLKKLVAGLSDENPKHAQLVQHLIDLLSNLSDFAKPPFDVAEDGRTHADQRPFGCASGRNGASRFILNAKKWWRFLIRAVPGTAILNFDFKGEEPAIAAYLSHDAALISAYESETGDIYRPVVDALGVSRKSAKACLLGIGYGRGAESVAEKEGVPYSEAKKILQLHRNTYRDYWRWSDAVVETVLRDRVLELPDGWALRIGDGQCTHEDLRTIRNFPIQGLGGVILRDVSLAAAKENITTIGTHHDSLMTESPLSKVDDDLRVVKQICAEVTRKYLGAEIRVKASVFDGQFKEDDDDAVKDWQRISEILKKY